MFFPADSPFVRSSLSDFALSSSFFLPLFFSTHYLYLLPFLRPNRLPTVRAVARMYRRRRMLVLRLLACPASLLLWHSSSKNKMAAWC